VGGRQIRWQTAGRAAAIAIAVLAGIISLPALLGSDRPPPVPADVGLAPPPEEPVPVRVPAATSAATSRPPKQAKDGRRRLTGRQPRPDRPRPRRSHRRRSHPRRSRHQDAPEAVVPPSTSTYTPPVYSYVPPAARPEFGFER
jgi:hypothetical protein